MDQTVVKLISFSAYFLLITIFSESLVFYSFKWKAYLQCFLGSLVLNLSSLILFGVFLYFFESKITQLAGIIGAHDESNLKPLTIWYLITVFIELPILYALNNKFSTNKTILISFVANLISFILLYIFISFIFS